MASEQQLTAPPPQRELTFGEKAVGLTFNPGGSGEVATIKINIGRVIDNINDLRNASINPEVKRMYSVAITELQTAQMWAVKAATWQY
jgi:hypothetical protein